MALTNHNQGFDDDVLSISSWDAMSDVSTQKNPAEHQSISRDNDEWEKVSSAPSVLSLATDNTPSEFSIISKPEEVLSEFSVYSVKENRDHSFSFAEIARMKKIYEQSTGFPPVARKKRAKVKIKKNEPDRITEAYKDFEFQFGTKADFDLPHAPRTHGNRKGGKCKNVTKW